MDDLGIIALVMVMFATIAWAWLAGEELMYKKVDKKYLSALLAIPFIVILVIAFELLSVPSGLYVGNITANTINATTYLNLPGSSAEFLTANIVSNTIYQNNQTSSIEIYAITQSAPLMAYLGSNSSNLTEVADLRGGSVTISSVVYQLAGYNMTATIEVPKGWYYKFNYTDATFKVIG